jgi:hypothetical protein
MAYMAKKNIKTKKNQLETTSFPFLFKYIYKNMNKILTEILHQIFKELLNDSPKDGYSVLMVNREWCNIIIPIL